MLAVPATTAKADLLPSLVGGNCGTTSQVFKAWGDARSYYFTSNGGFESGSNGWTLAGGARVVAENESFNLHGKADRSSLLVPDRGTATSPKLCIGLLYPGIRMVAKSPSGTGKARVRVIARGLLGVLAVLDGGTVTPGRAWAPTPVLSTLISNLNVPLGAKSIQLVIEATGDVQIDDIYIDPFLQR
jgi:hypothetical protein